MAIQTSLRQVDRSALRVNQAGTITLLLLSFVFNAPWLAGGLALLNLLGALNPRLNLFVRLYRHALRPAGLVKPDIVPDNPEPHRFAQGLGVAFVGLGVLALVAGQPVLGWALIWLVVGLAAVNLFLGFCVGCFLYYQLNRRGVPWFRYSQVKRSG